MSMNLDTLMFATLGLYFFVLDNRQLPSVWMKIDPRRLNGMIIAITYMVTVTRQSLAARLGAT